MARHDVVTELFYDGAWNEARAYGRDGVTISRGRGDEQSRGVPSNALSTLDNRTGDYNPRNPTSVLYGLAGRNTPCRVRFDTVTTTTVTEDFEDDQLVFTFTSGGDKDWARNSGTSHGGSWAYRVGGLTNQTATLDILVPAGATEVSFWYLDSGGLETFSVKFDGAGAQDLTVNGVWTQATFALDGVAELTITTTDSAGGSAFGYIDDLTFTIPTHIRHVGEVASWKPDRTDGFDAGMGDAWTGVEVAGVLRRLGQGADPLLSALHQLALASAFQSGVQVAAQYWPCEDAAGATQFGSGLSNAPPLTYTGEMTLATSDIFPGSDRLPQFGTGGNFSGFIPSTPADTTGHLGLRMLLYIPTGHSIPNGTTLFNLYVTGGSVATFAFVYTTASGGGLTVKAVQGDGTVADSTTTHTGLDGNRVQIFMGMDQSGIDVSYRFSVYTLSTDGQTVTEQVELALLSSVIIGRGDRFTGGGSSTMAGCVFGHIGIFNDGDFMSDILNGHDALLGYIGEPAATRVQRLATGAGITVTLVGDADNTVPMGPQPVDTLLNILTECERTDGGILYEPRSTLGLTYRTRASLYNQTAALTLDWDQKQVALPLTPVLDDQNTRNDVTAKRDNGSSARAVQTTGPLNVSSPADDPDGVGRYATEISVNPQTDAALADVASWYLRLGTVDETRFPQVTVDLDRSPSLASAASAVDIGDLIVVQNMPADLSPDDLRLIVVGYTETLAPYRRVLTYNCIPEAAYRVAEADGDPRVDTDGTERTGTPIASGASSATFTITNGEFWVTGDTVSNPTDFPIPAMLGGEEVSITAIAAPSGNTQLFTITRSVNGVVKSHPVGTKIHVRDPAYAPL